MTDQTFSEKDTKTRILDTAEKLFAQNGYHGASMRIITKMAAVNLAAVHYHFGSKKDLLRAVIERRLLPLNQEREARFQSLEERVGNEKEPVRAAEALRAFIEPALSFKKTTPEAKYCVALIGRALVEPDDTVRSLFLSLMKPIVVRLFHLLIHALPHIPQAVLFWRLHFALGAMGHAMTLDKNGIFAPEGMKPDLELHDFTDAFLIFVSAGMEASP